MQNPPKFPTRMLRFFCPGDLLEGVEGDLAEAFYADLKNGSGRRARWLYFYNVLRFFRLEIISRNKFKNSMINRGLLISHIKITLRNFRKYFSYSFINLTGLALGIAVCLLIYSYTNHQLHYDDFHPDIERLYRVNQTSIWDPEGGMMGSTPPPLAQQLIENSPQVESVLRINTPGGYEVRHQHKSRGLLIYRENNVLAADSNFFEFFALPLIRGNRKNALAGKNMVVITEAIALKYFGDDDPVGQTILMNQEPVQITGVTPPLPSNMHFEFDFLLSMPSNPSVRQFDWSWIWTQMVTYTKLKKGSDPESLKNQVTEILNPQVRSCIDRLGMDYEEFIQDKGSWQFAFQPVRDIHLHSLEEGNRIGEIGDIKSVRVLQILALLILIIAIINFINLSTARANLRTREIGVKKVMGALRSSLSTQFHIEAIVMTLVAAALSIPLFFMLIALVKNQVGIDIYYHHLITVGNSLKLLAVFIAIGLVAGIYPAFYLTSFKPVNILGGESRDKGNPIRLRYILVAVQFAISLTLLSGSFLVAKQLKFLTKKDLGFDRDNILIVNHAGDLGDQIKSFRDEIRALPYVVNASITMDMPGRGSWEDIFMREGSDIKLAISQLKIDPYFFPTMQLKTIAGRAFSEDRTTDIHHAIINETTARLWGWSPNDALGKQIIYFELEPRPTIVGVV
ncbi:MAG: hypothetical protein HKN76_08990, partial [Saprospiraceae bacterium]|nr:hypothetical protein [Saprospiraceae bacterium]